MSLLHHHDEYDYDPNKDYDKSILHYSEYIDYLFKEEKVFTGTNSEVDEYIRQNYSEQQYEETLEENIPDKFWFNGEVAIIRIKDGKVVFSTEYKDF